MYRWAPIDCKNIVHFSNRSSVVTSMGKLNNDEPEKYYWDFGNGTTSTQKNPTVDFGSAGGEFEVTLVASLFNDNCMDTFKLNVSLPAIDTFYVNVVERICKKGSVIMNGVEYSETGIYVDTMQSIAGCDSIVTLDLMIVDKYEDFDTVSPNEISLYNDFDCKTVFLI